MSTKTKKSNKAHNYNQTKRAKKPHQHSKTNTALQEERRTVDTIDVTPEIKAVEEMVEKAGYPDISKATTKNVVIGSAIVILLVLILSILFPPSTNKESTTEKAETRTQEEAKATTTKEMTTQTDSTLKLSSDAISWLFPEYRICDAQSGFYEIADTTYYFEKGDTPFSGWLNIDNNCYYIQADGRLSTGWTQIHQKWYYFAADGHMLTEQWVGDRYVGSTGAIYQNRLTPDGVYVDKNGYIDDSLGTTNSTAGLSDLKATLEEMLSGYHGTWSIYVKDIENNEYLSINNTQIFSASLIKLFCGAAAYDLMDRGILEENERILSLMAQMLSISDNDAFCLMVAECSGINSQVAGRPVIQKYIDKEGYKGTTITSMLLPTKYRAPSSPGRNLTTVEDCGLLLEKIYKGKCVNPEVSQKFLDLLLNQSHVNKIPAGLPEGTKCANKTGDTDKFQHDAAIVYSPSGDYIIAVMSENGGASIVNIQKLSETVYNYFNGK